jgi:hypothetical protein
MDWTMKVLEETTEALGTEREQYFYDTLKPLYNQCRPGQTRKEYSQTETRKATKKAYRQTEAGRISQKASVKAYQQTDAYKAYMKAYHKAYRQSEAYKDYQKAYYQKTKLNSVQD